MSRFAAVPTAALDDDRLEALHIRVLTALCSYADKDGWCRVGQDQIAKRARTNPARVSQCISDLVSWGWLRRQRVGKMKVNVYQVLMDCELDASIPIPVEQEQLADTANHVTCSVSKSELPREQITLADTANPIGTPFLNTVSNTPARPKRAKPKAAEQPEPDIAQLALDTIWAKWSKTGRERVQKNKSECLKLLRKIGKEHDLREVTKAALAYARKTDPEWHQGLDTWLKNGRHLNFVAAARAATASPEADGLNDLERAFQSLAQTGEWMGDRIGHPIHPNRPDAPYPAELYQRFAINRQGAAA